MVNNIPFEKVLLLLERKSEGWISCEEFFFHAVTKKFNRIIVSLNMSNSRFYLEWIWISTKWFEVMVYIKCSISFRESFTIYEIK